MAKNVFHLRDIDVDDIKIHDLKQIEGLDGTKFAYMSYKGVNLKFQTPLLKIPYDFNSTYKSGDKDTVKNDLTLSFGDYKTNEANKLFYEKMEKLNDHVVNHVMQNKNKFLGCMNKPDMYVKDVANKPLVKPCIDRETQEISDKYPPTIKFKIPTDKLTGAYNIKCINSITGEEVEFNDIKGKLKGAYGKFIVHITGIWNTGIGFGVQGKITLAKFTIKEDEEDEFLSSDSEDEDKKVLNDDNIDDELIKTAKDMQQLSTKVSKKQSEVPIDSEEEEDDDDDEEGSNDQVIVKPVESEEEEEEEEKPLPPVKKTTKKSSVASKKK